MFRWAFWFVFANALLLMLVSLKYLKMMPVPEAMLARTFLGLSYPGHFYSLALCTFPLIAIAILAYPKRGFVFACSVLLELSLVLTIVIDTLVFAQYRFHLNGMIWNLLTSGAAGEVLPMSAKLWLVLALAIVLLGAFQWLIALGCWRWVTRPRRRLGLALGGFFLLLILSAQVMHAWADANNFTSITSQVRYLPAYKPLTMKRLLTKLGFASKEAPGHSLQVQKGKSALRYPIEAVQFDEGGSKKTNLLFIVVESWRFDCMSAEVTPNIWRFSQQNWRFDNHYSSGNCTRFGIFGIFYGLYGTYWHAALAEEHSPVLMREMQKRAYRMGIFGSAPLINPEFDRTVFADIKKKVSLHTEGGSVYQRDREVATKMVQFLSADAGDAPFFGFLFFDGPHTAEHPPGWSPFKPALKEVNYLGLKNDFDPVPFKNKYKNSVNYVDSLVGEVLATLEKKKLLNNTVVVITGDHGEEFNDLKLNYWGHCGNFSKFQTQTPLIVHWPGKEPRQFSHLTSHLDIAPSVLKEMLGCRTDPSKYSNGRYLWDNTERPFTVISSWDTFSINESDRITVSRASGEVEVLDPLYRPLPGAQVRPKISMDAMEGMGRFFAR